MPIRHPSTVTRRHCSNFHDYRRPRVLGINNSVVKRFSR
jgi:hypothetical protein